MEGFTEIVQGWIRILIGIVFIILLIFGFARRQAQEQYEKQMSDYIREQQEERMKELQQAVMQEHELNLSGRF